MSNPRAGTRHGEAGVPSITSVQEPLAEDQARRTRRYLLQMGIRVVCFLGAIVVDDGWLRVVMIVAAVVIPYVAVIFANAGRDKVTYETSAVPPAAPAALPAAAARPTAPDATPRVVEHEDATGDAAGQERAPQPTDDEQGHRGAGPHGQEDR